MLSMAANFTTGAEYAELTAELLSLPLPPAVSRADIRDRVAAMTGLCARVQDLRARARRFTADAAHELRTPIAALKAQAQVAQRAATDAERQSALAKVIQACDRTARLIEQLLTLARLEPAHWRERSTSVDLHALALERAFEMVEVLGDALLAKGDRLLIGGTGET